MLRTRFGCLVGLLILSGLPAAPASAQPRPAVLIVGTYHMANPGADLGNVVADDILAPKRQQEVARLVELLAAFRPTVVAVEVPFARQASLDTRYAAFRRGEQTLSRSESEQVGFRLAASLGLQHVYAVDHPQELDMMGVVQFAMANGFAPFAQQMLQTVQAEVARIGRAFPTMSVPELVALHNEPRMDAAHAYYLRAAQIGRDSTYIGAQMASAWFSRNIHIYANIARTVTAPDTRVLVLIGAGHTRILRDMIRDAGEWDLVDPLPLLRR